jgi:hypothetical protein
LYFNYFNKFFLVFNVDYYKNRKKLEKKTKTNPNTSKIKNQKILRARLRLAIKILVDQIHKFIIEILRRLDRIQVVPVRAKRPPKFPMVIGRLPLDARLLLPHLNIPPQKVYIVNLRVHSAVILAQLNLHRLYSQHPNSDKPKLHGPKQAHRSKTHQNPFVREHNRKEHLAVGVNFLIELFIVMAQLFIPQVAKNLLFLQNLQLNLFPQQVPIAKQHKKKPSLRSNLLFKRVNLILVSLKVLPVMHVPSIQHRRVRF